MSIIQRFHCTTPPRDSPTYPNGDDGEGARAGGRGSPRGDVVRHVGLEVGSNVAVQTLLHVPRGRVVLAEHLVLGVARVHDQQVGQVM